MQLLPVCAASPYGRFRGRLRHSSAIARIDHKEKIAASPYDSWRTSRLAQRVHAVVKGRQPN